MWRERKAREKEGGCINSVQKQLVPGEGAAAGVWQGSGHGQMDSKPHGELTTRSKPAG